MEDLDELNDLEINVINDLLNPNRKQGIDPKKITYDYYRSYEFWRNKFPKGWEFIPGFEDIIQTIHQDNIDSNNSPLKEMDKRQNKFTVEDHKILYQSSLYEH